MSTNANKEQARPMRFGLTPEMREEEVAVCVKKHLEERRQMLRRLSLEEREKLVTLRRYLKEIFFLYTGETVVFSEKEPIEAVIETYVENRMPEKVRELDSEEHLAFKARFLKDMKIGDRHVLLGHYVYEINSEKENTDYIIDTSAVVAYAKENGMTLHTRIREDDRSGEKKETGGEI